MITNTIIENYLPYDLRQIKDKNRISLSKELLKRLNNPEEIIFSVFSFDGEERILLFNAKDTNIKGREIAKVKVDGKSRCAIPSAVQEELGFKNKKNKRFVGIIEITTSYGNFIELCRIGRIGKNEV